MRRRYYSQDPFWMVAKFASVCSCGAKISKGEDIFYYPNGRKAVCGDCGRRGESDLRDEILNEQFHIR